MVERAAERRQFQEKLMPRFKERYYASSCPTRQSRMLSVEFVTFTASHFPVSIPHTGFTISPALKLPQFFSGMARCVAGTNG
jgi:hypothetical protein